MHHIVMYSGGLGSWATAMRVAERHGTKDMTLLFTDTLTEDEDLYRFLDDSSSLIGLPITRIADGRDIWQVFEDVRYMGNSRIDPCSRVLKREISRRWVEEHFAPGDAMIYVGIDWSESHRMEKIRKQWSPYEVVAPLTDRPYLDRSGILSQLKGLGVRPPRLYELGFSHNNCGGFCVKAGQAQFFRLLETMPDRYAEHEAAQERLFAKIGRYPFLRRQENGKTIYESLQDFRERIEAGNSIDPFDWGGCGCFA